jgi:hypothetical protein
MMTVRFKHVFVQGERYLQVFTPRQERRPMNTFAERAVIPAKAGIHGKCEAWIPAFAGMTSKKH